MSRVFSFFSNADSDNVHTPSGNNISPSLELETDKDVYRPGDSVYVNIKIVVPDLIAEGKDRGSSSCSFLIERLAFEMKGIEKLDPQWFATQKPLSGSKQRRGEHVFVECEAPSIVSNQIVSSGVTKIYMVRILLPSVIPPSYRGTTIRYLYLARSTLSGKCLVLDNGCTHMESFKDLKELEARIPLHVWASNGLHLADGGSDGLAPATVKLDIYLKDMEGDVDWVRADAAYDGFDEDYDSSRDDLLSISSINPMKGIHYKTFGSISLQSFSGRSPSKVLFPEVERASLSSSVAPLQLSVSEIPYKSCNGIQSPDSPRLSSLITPLNLPLENFLPHPIKSTDVVSVFEDVESSISEGFVRGRSYNIKLDEEVLLRFSPMKSDTSYCFNDMIGGTLSFCGGSRRCLEVSIALEISEKISKHFVHLSRRNSRTTTKIVSEDHQVVADLAQTSFLFSIPPDGPMSFSTPRVAVQWALRFEFYTTPRSIDWTRLEHPLLVQSRDKCEWSLPIVVQAPPSRAPAAQSPIVKSISLDSMWTHE